MSMWSAQKKNKNTQTRMHMHTHTETHTERRHQVALCHSVSACLSVSFRSSKEAGGLPHVKPTRQEETREEVHGGAQCHRWRLPRAGQEGYWYDAAWAKVRVQVQNDKVKRTSMKGERESLCVCVFCACVEDLAAQWFQMVWQRAWLLCQQDTMWKKKKIYKQRLTLCSLCLLSHCSKSVYSKSLDIPDASTKCSKEERYSLVTHSPCFHLLSAPCLHPHARRRPWQDVKMQRSFAVALFLHCDDMCSKRQPHRSVLIHCNSSDK